MIEFNMQNMINEISNQVDIENDKRWMEVKDVELLPVMLDVTHGGWVTFLRAKAGTTLLTHYHVNGLYVFTISGHWRYSEHDWEARDGHFLYEAPGEKHTLTFIEDTMFFSVIPAGPIIYLDGSGEIAALTDVFTHLTSVRKHYKEIGLTEEDVKKIIR